MHPYLLKGHSRSLTFVKYNRDGDLIFSCSKDHIPCVWRSANGERLGSYNGHNGAVYGCDVTPDSTLLLTASADQSVKLWDVRTGRQLFHFPQKSAAKSVVWGEGEKLFAVACDAFGSDVLPHINIYGFADKKEEQSDAPSNTIVFERGSQATKIAWMPLNSALIVGFENGKIALFDVSKPGGVKIAEWQAHDGRITSMSFNAEKTLLVTSSADKTAKLWDIKERKMLQRYEAEVPLNGAAIAPNREIVIAGGGQEAMNVTMTSVDSGKFETRFFHMVFGKELGRLKGHFGPINTLAFNPDGRSFASGGEDGYIRLHMLDEEYDRLGDAEEKELDDPALGDMLARGELETLLAQEAAEQERAQYEAAALAAATSTGAEPLMARH